MPDGYVPLRCATRRSYALLRSNYSGGRASDIAAAVEYGRRLRVYPLANAASPPPTRFVDAADVVFDATIPYDLRFFEVLARVVEQEDRLPRDRVMSDVLRSIGIVKGRPFTPDDHTCRLLDAAAAEARALIDLRFEQAFEPPFNPGRLWAVPVARDSRPTSPIRRCTRSRHAASRTPSRSSRRSTSAPGQFYLYAIHDADGNALDGGRSYRLRVPADPPVTLYWSVTAYDRATHALIREQPRSSCSSNADGLATNADGTVDVWFGPRAPTGAERNWVSTDPAGGFEVMFRLYGPTPALFDHTWVLPDLEPVGTSG